MPTLNLQKKTKKEINQRNENTASREMRRKAYNNPEWRKLRDIYIKEHPLCEDCLNATGTCQMCEFSKTCDFETNPSTLPKVVQKVVQRGNMQMATQVRNPEREKITCAAGCKCYNEKYGCSRQDNLCINYDFRQKS